MLRRGSRCGCRNRSVQHLLTAAAMTAATMAGGSSHAATTGWDQTGAGPYDYNTASNWVGSTINDVFDASLTLTAPQLITLAGNRTAPGGLTIGYSGDYDLAIESDAAASKRTISLLGDLVFTPQSTGRTLSIGGDANANPVGVTFGGTTLRSILVGDGNTIEFGSTAGITASTAVGGFNIGVAGSTVYGGTVVLSGSVSTVTSGQVLAVNSGRFVLAATGDALNTVSSTRWLTLNGGEIEFRTDSTVRGYHYTVSASSGVIANRATAGTNVTQGMGTVTFVGASPVTLSYSKGDNVSGQATVTIGAFQLNTSGTIDVAAGTAVTAIGKLDGTGGFTKAGAGILSLQTTSTRLAATTVDAGTLRLFGTSGASLGSNSSTATLQLNGGKLALALDNPTTFNGTYAVVGGNSTIEVDRNTPGLGAQHGLKSLTMGNHQLSVTAGGNVNSGLAGLSTGPVTLSGNPTLSVGSGAYVFIGAVSDNGTPRTLTLQGSGASLLNTASPNWSAGSTLNIAAGHTVLVNRNDILTAGKVSIANSGRLILANNVSMGALSGPGDLIATKTVTATINHGGTSTISGVIRETPSLVATLTDPGHSYTANPTVTVGPPDVLAGGIPATAATTFASNTITGISINNPGVGYTTPPAITITGNGMGATAVTSFVDSVLALNFAGTGTTILSGANTWRGATAIQGGEVRVGSLNRVVGGTASSNLGAPTTTATGTISIGTGADAAQLTYTGTGETTDRVLRMAGSTGGVVLDMSGTGTLTFTSDFVNALDGNKTVTLQGSTAGVGRIEGKIPNRSSFTTGIHKTGTGRWILTADNAYSGGTVVEAGTLEVSNTAGSGTGTAAVVVDGASAGAFGTLAGTGSINGAITVQGFGRLDPGADRGVLTAKNGVTFTGPDASFAVQIDGLTPGSASDQHDQLLVTAGNVSLGGSLVVSFGDFAAAEGDVVYLINNTGAGVRTGAFQFADDAFVTAANGMNWHITYDASVGTGLDGGNDVALYAASAVPEPGTLGVMAIAGLTLLRRRRRGC